ncbi:K(+) efflux antiporter 2, chloroplastic [Selaginella moellendorffii]|uniref:K(+) efflux antiporter 2, chloroplastic n=1 Tax=Selaginella moellendorffii TaxID=88036 RepID=UPI000D1C6675|nr:K(+) efflux antiporter 2, chloroplastic [Selaginella moellendorffii]|eukprot:XP_002987899.2 K(+) efflux antiporter 2, chloroplastic [Selaginella moellendorffii]
MLLSCDLVASPRQVQLALDWRLAAPCRGWRRKSITSVSSSSRRRRGRLGALLVGQLALIHRRRLNPRQHSSLDCSSNGNQSALLRSDQDNGGAVGGDGGDGLSAAFGGDGDDGGRDGDDGGGGRGQQQQQQGVVDKDVHLAYLKEVARIAHSELERARLHSRELEGEAQRFAERAIALGDEATNISTAAANARTAIDKLHAQEAAAREAVEKESVVLSAAKRNIKMVEQELDAARTRAEETAEGPSEQVKEQQALLESAWLELQKSEEAFRNCQLEVSRMENAYPELQTELDRLETLADAAKAVALAAEDDVAKAMSLAEQAVAVELEAAQRLNDAEIALQKAETPPAATVTTTATTTTSTTTITTTATVEKNALVAAQMVESTTEAVEELVQVEIKDKEPIIPVKSKTNMEKSEAELPEVPVGLFSQKSDTKAAEVGNLKSFTKKSSRFFPASFFSFDEAEEFSPSSLFSGLLLSVRQNILKVAIGGVLLLGGAVFVAGRAEKASQLIHSSEAYVATSAKPLLQKLDKLPSRIKVVIDKLSKQEVNEEEASLFDVLWLLLASVVFVPVFQKIPGGSPVLGYLAAGVLIGPHSLHIIRNVHGTKAIAEFGVVFLLFNIGLELSVERLSSMRKYVFGFGSSQVLATALASGLFAYYVSGLTLPAAIVIGNGLALSSTAVVLQVLQERGESTSRHGRSAFSVLLFQDLAVVVLLILIPLLSPNSSRGGAGLNAIAEALGIAAVKGVIAISGIIAGGRLLLRPIYRSMAENHNAEIFAANTLLVVLGTSVLTARAGLSMALGAFLAGLLLSETEFALQVESDIAPYRGLLLGLFFMTVGMSIDPQLFLAKSNIILGSLALLIVGKAMLIACLGRQFGLSSVAALRTGLLLAPGGEFAFVAFGEAVNQGIMSQQLSSLMFLIVGLSMALTPWLAAAGQIISTKFDQQDVRSLLPAENETDDLEGHMIVCGFGRVGQIISQMLSERLIPFVALDVRSERVSMGRALDLPVYFGDAGSKEVLHKLGADRAAAAVITLDTPGANYRAVWALSKYFPKVKTYVRAHDVDHGINLEKAGATAVVPETLEPSLQLAAAVLAEAKLPASEIASTINEFRSRHLAELTELTKKSGTSLGYGFSQNVGAKPKQSSAGKSEDDGSPDRRFEGVIAVP